MQLQALNPAEMLSPAELHCVMPWTMILRVKMLELYGLTLQVLVSVYGGLTASMASMQPRLSLSTVKLLIRHGG